MNRLHHPWRWPLLAACLDAVVLALGAALRAILVVVTVQNRSMSPTLNAGDRVLVVRHWPAGWLRKGRIVIVWPWSRSHMRSVPFGVPSPFIKRIIAMPGDTLVSTLGDLDVEHRERLRAAHDERGQRIWHIPPGHCFVRGDYPLGGWDSLSWGPIPFQCVLGVVVMQLPRTTNSGRTESHTDQHVQIDESQQQHLEISTFTIHPGTVQCELDATKVDR